MVIAVRPSKPSRRHDRADALTTRAEVGHVFVRQASARIFVAATVALVAGRVAVGAMGPGDIVVASATCLIAGPVEWVIHRFLLHARPDAWTSRALGTGTGHREHHLDPPAIDWLMLRRIDAAVVVIAFGAITTVWTLPLLRLTGSATAGPFLTAWALAAGGLAHYEWVHLLVHSRYRCRSRYYSRLARNHRLHHFRNEHYWLGVTTNLGDRMLGTYPTDRSAVPISTTARAIDG
ncbi:MAG: sterol desaturase family protein [Ilumatobacteraceae bacterium]